MIISIPAFYTCNDDMLRTAFESFGELENVHVAMDRSTGQSKGFGFVTFSESDSANSALQELNGSELDGRTIRVDTATERSRGGGGGGGPRRGGGGGGGSRW